LDPGGPHKSDVFFVFERISKIYESFECFLPGVEFKVVPTFDQMNSFIFNKEQILTKFEFGA